MVVAAVLGLRLINALLRMLDNRTDETVHLVECLIDFNFSSLFLLLSIFSILIQPLVEELYVCSQGRQIVLALDKLYDGIACFTPQISLLRPKVLDKHLVVALFLESFVDPS